jgi:hypothetical protein
MKRHHRPVLARDYQAQQTLHFQQYQYHYDCPPDQLAVFHRLEQLQSQS